MAAPDVLLAVLAVAFVAAQTSQKSQIRLDKNQAIAKTGGEIDFTPRRTQIRLLRHGLNSKAILDPLTVETGQARRPVER